MNRGCKHAFVDFKHPGVLQCRCKDADARTEDGVRTCKCSYRGAVMAPWEKCTCYEEQEDPLKKDMVDRPSHYSRYGIETIDALKGSVSPEEFNGFLKGNAFKYLTRAGAKDSLEQDLHKVCWYAMFLYLTNGGSVESLGKTYEYMKGRFTK